MKPWKISALKKAGFNPKSRLREVAGLAESIERVGLLYPVLITRSGDVIDGHRRIAAFEKLGRTEIPVIIAEGNRAEMFAEVNASSKIISGNQQLQIYLKEPGAVGTRARHVMQECESVVGRAVLRRMASQGFSMATWKLCKKIAREGDQDTPEVAQQLLKWMMHLGNVGVVRAAMHQGAAAGTMIAASVKMKPIKPRYGE